MTDQPEPTKKKSTKAEVKKRVATVADLLALGVTRAGILKHVAEKTDWKLTERQIDKYIARAADTFRQAGEIDRSKEYNEAIHRMRLILATSMKTLDLPRAIAASKELHALMGLYPPAKSELKIDGLTEFALVAEAASAAGKDVKTIISMMLELMGVNKP